MLYKWRNRLARAFYDYRCRGVLETAPLEIRPAPLLFCSMVSHRDIIMYLVAIKSVYRAVGEGTILVLNDGSLTEGDLALLRHHLGDPEILRVPQIDPAPCPRGGCWERLVTVLTRTADSYVIQVDSDILALGDLDAVVDSYRANRSFLVGTASGRELVSAQAATKFAEGIKSEHVQILAERQLAHLPGGETALYVRGCAGFAGYAAGSDLLERAQWLSTEMERLIGRRWHDWGSEQMTSNYVIANSRDARVLPYPDYINYAPNVAMERSELLHFIGDWRFYRGNYAAASRQIVARFGRD